MPVRLRTRSVSDMRHTHLSRTIGSTSTDSQSNDGASGIGLRLVRKVKLGERIQIQWTSADVLQVTLQMLPVIYGYAVVVNRKTNLAQQGMPSQELSSVTQNPLRTAPLPSAS